MKIFFYKLFLTITILTTIFSCVSIQEDIVLSSTAGEESRGDFLLVEQELVNMEGTFFLGKEKIEAAKADELIKKIDSMLGDVNLQSAMQAKLMAFQGRLCHITGRLASAKVYHQQAANTYKGEIQSIILGIRLNPTKDESDLPVAKTDQAFLSLESAIQFYQKEDYSQAVAKFDEAFISLPDFYRTSYEPLRNNAWNLKEISSETTSEAASILKQDSINVLQMIKFTQNTTDLLYKFTASKKLSDDSLVKLIASCGLFNASNPDGVQSTGIIRKDTTVTRILAARFLWNIYLGKTDLTEDKKNYAQMFSAAGFSPVKDLPLDCADFDAVLGCIENEIMELPDGINFFPEDKITGVEFNASLNKLK